MDRLTDQQLLRDYAKAHSEAAFSELVRRHVDFVHSAARRMVCDSHLAEDVTQGVFLALAKNSAQLARHPVLSGWLHRTAQNIAAQTVRTEVRRRNREQEAAAMTEPPATGTDAAWETIAPHLDSALGELSEPDRDALFLRYFERKSASEIGQILDTSEEAAQKRVSRAVERLREFLAKRGVAAGTGGLAAVLAANAVEAAPAGVASALSAIGITGGAFTAVTLSKTIAMTTLQKTIITAALATAVGTGIYGAHQAAKVRQQDETLQLQNAHSSEQVRQLQDDKKQLAARLSALANDLERTRNNQGEVLKLRAEISRLRKEGEALALDVKEAKDFQADISEMMSNTPPIRTFLATATVTAAWNETVAVGGWKIPSGKRAMMFATFYPADNGQNVGIQSKILEYTDEAGKALGLDQYNAAGQNADTPHKFSAEQYHALLKLAADKPGVDMLVSPEVITGSGRAAAIQVQNDRQTPSGEKYQVGPTLNFTPIIAPDGQSVQSAIAAQLNCLLRPDKVP